MQFSTNAVLRTVSAPPIADAHRWIAGRTFPKDRPLLDVSQAVPSYAPAQDMQQFLAEEIQKPGTALYTQIAGLPVLREALAEALSIDYAGRIQAENIAITAGGNEAFSVAMMALAGPGDEVLLPLPYYFNHQMWLQTLGIAPVYVPFNRQSGGTPDLDAIASRITPRTRALVLVTPNNPTGAVYAPEFLEQCFDLCKQAGIALVLDETYKDFRDDVGVPPHRLFFRPDWEDVLIHLYSFSKVYALTGFRVGSLTAGAAVQLQVAKLLDCITICAPHIGQLAAWYGLTHLNPWREEKRLEMRAKKTALQLVFAKPVNGFRLVSSGAYFAYLEHPFPGKSAFKVAHKLADEANILILPGSMFGPEQDAYLRVAFANLNLQALQELGKRLESFRI
jgi:aspartate/methionine/tyrosine aminotransferase